MKVCSRSNLTSPTARQCTTTPVAEPVVTDDKKSTELDFFERIASFRPEDWQGGLKVYFYRLAPIIDRKDG